MKRLSILIALSSLLGMPMTSFAAKPTLAELEADAGKVYQWHRSRNDADQSEMRKLKIATCRYTEAADGTDTCTEKPREAELVDVVKYFGSTNEIGKRDQKRVTVIERPAADKGVSTLIFAYDAYAKDQETWLHLPDVGKVRRLVSPADGDEPNPSTIFGSEYNTEDTEPQPLNDYTYKILRSEQFNGRDCFVIEKRPTASRLKKSLYSVSEDWIDKEFMHLQRRINFNRQGKASKEFVYYYDGAKFAARTTVAKNLIDKRMSRLQVLEIKKDVEIDSGFFTQRALTDKLYQESVLGKAIKVAAAK